MAVGIVDRQKLVNIADAVRAKKGITGNMTLDAIASNITSMPTANNNANFDFSVSKSEGDLLSYLTTVDLSGLDISSYTDMNSMFQNCISLTSLDLSNFNTSKVAYMTSMFQDCRSLTSLDLSNWNTSNFYNMYCMFSGCSSLTSLDVSNWNTSTAGVMYGVFENCSSLTSLDLSNWNTSEVEVMSSMFLGCSSLTSLDLSNFNTSKVIEMKGMFYNCSKLSNLTLGNDWAINSSISSFSLSSCPLTHDSAIDVINKLATRDNSPVITFSTAVGLYQSEIDVATNKGWSVSGCRVLVDAESATVGQYALIDGVISKCIYVADTPQGWGQKIFAYEKPLNDRAYQWGGSGTATGITETAIGTGLTNTNALLAMNLQSTNGTPTIWDVLKEFRTANGDRWFIPSREEAKFAYTEYNCWTSSEYDSGYAYYCSSRINTDAQGKYSYYVAHALTYV